MMRAEEEINSLSMNVQQIIKKQGWAEKKEGSIFVYEFEKDPDTLKIFLTETDSELDKLKNKLWNIYYSRVLIYKQNGNQYKVWTNNQSPQNEGCSFSGESFDERISPIEYWDRYITKTPRNTVDKKLEESILAVFRELDKKYTNKDDLISIILACTFIRFLEDRNLSDVSGQLINALSSKDNAVELFKEYNGLHNGMLFKQNTLYELDDDTCRALKNFLEANLFNQKSLFHFDFKYIPIELISNIYEKLLTEKLGKKQKKDQGVAYTPPKLASYLTKEAFKQIDQKMTKKSLPSIKIGDLSTGSGIFLVLSFRELLKRINGNMSFRQKKKILEESFYGIDLDESAINITTFSLYIELLEYEKNKKLSPDDKFPILKNNIKSQDALSYSECDFDLIIGNPPWGSRPDYFEKIKGKEFSKNIANKESAQIFVNIAIEKLKDNGTLAFVLPSKSFYNPQSFDFRNFLMKNMIIKEFVDFSPIRSHVFRNHVEASVIVGEKNNHPFHSYSIPVRRVINEADYLYFNHVSGNTNNIDSYYLQSRNDSWQVAIRGGNMAALFINRLTNNYISLGKVVKNITTGYQGCLKGNGAQTISESQRGGFSTPIIYDPGKKYYCARSKKASPSHKLLDNSFIENECLIIYKKYKFHKANRLRVSLKPRGTSFSEYFVGIMTNDKDLLYFLATLLTSRAVMFFVNMTGATTPLLSKEERNPKINRLDIKKIPIPKRYSEFTDIIKIGKKLIDSNFSNLSELQDNIDAEVERMFQVDVLEKYVMRQWEKITKRKKIDSYDKRLKSYQRGFEYILDSYGLPKPKKWGDPKIINGVEIISFSETAKQPDITDKIRQKIRDIVTAKRDMDFEFVADSQGVIVRREKNNCGFLTGLLDAELILSNL